MVKGSLMVIALGLVLIGIALFLLPNSTISLAGKQHPKTILPSANNAFFSHGTSSEIAFVPRVIDGDTIQVQVVDQKTGGLGVPESVRYIGMDTPETVHPNKPVECFGHEASARNKQLVEGSYVVLEKDVDDRDKYGRLLRFVFLLDGTFIDMQLVQEGYARKLTIAPDIQYADQFASAESTAQASGLGFWGACPSYPFV